MDNLTIKHLKKRIVEIENELAQVGTRQDLIDEKMSHLKSIDQIEFVVNNNVNIKGKVLNLPYIDGYGGPYYSFRVVLEEETTDREDWVLIDKIDGISAELFIGDQIITT